ncbi:hypothetical protein, partial [Lysinibacillus fusiformis]|uniref:hypothetical protein n=1 Tax=Lysinibacillus fusiformis TaxID=28031 RepID=UPI0020BF48BB
FSITALVFIIIGKFNFAVLAMTIMFALSNGFRAKSFAEQGYVKEAKWMKYMAIFFAIASIAVFVIVLTD